MESNQPMKKWNKRQPFRADHHQYHSIHKFRFKKPEFRADCCSGPNEFYDKPNDSKRPFRN